MRLKVISEGVLFENKQTRVQALSQNARKMAALNQAIMKDNSAMREVDRIQPDEANQAVLGKLAEADPTTAGKYLNWILLRYTQGNFRLEDLGRLQNSLTTFEQVKNRLQQKDINQYRSLADLEDAIEPVAQQDAPVSGKEEQRQERAEAEKDTNVIMKGKNITVLTPQSENAACYWGRGTKWCTAATQSKNYFRQYRDDGELYILMVKNPSGGERKFQLQMETSQFMDERDEPIRRTDVEFLSQFPEYTDFLNMLIKKYY